jgi:hypothetical protein
VITEPGVIARANVTADPTGVATVVFFAGGRHGGAETPKPTRCGPSEGER